MPSPRAMRRPSSAARRRGMTARQGAARAEVRIVRVGHGATGLQVTAREVPVGPAVDRVEARAAQVAVQALARAAPAAARASPKASRSCRNSYLSCQRRLASMRRC